MQFRGAKSRPFEEENQKSQPSASSSETPSQAYRQPPAQHVPRAPAFSPPVVRAGPIKYVSEDEKYAGDTGQSRTFNVLRSLMENEGETEFKKNKFH